MLEYIPPLLRISFLVIQMVLYALFYNIFIKYWWSPAAIVWVISMILGANGGNGSAIALWSLVIFAVMFIFNYRAARIWNAELFPQPRERRKRAILIGAEYLETMQSRISETYSKFGMINDANIQNRDEKRRILIARKGHEILINDAGRKKVFVYLASIREAIGYIEPGGDNRNPITMINGYLDEIRSDPAITATHISLPMVRQDVELLTEALRNLGFENDLAYKRLVATFDL